MTEQTEQKSIAFFDIDRTAYKGFLLEPLATRSAESNLISADAFDGMKQIYGAYSKGELQYETAVERILATWARGLEGRTVEEVEKFTQNYLDNDGDNFYPYVGEIVEKIRDSHDIYFVTGEPQFVARMTAERYGAQGFLATEFETVDGVFTGNINSALSHRHHKRDAIEGLIATRQYEGSMAFGDSEGDIEMLEDVEYPICVVPTPGLREHAEARGWFIADVPDEQISPHVDSIISQK
ncbi:MAG TPA: HAD family phosphatase [Patescibacteria group bacterium]|nr:HAD family phosphatase [Patescibacteria group bacterium]